MVRRCVEGGGGRSLVGVMIKEELGLSSDSPSRTIVKRGTDLNLCSDLPLTRLLIRRHTAWSAEAAFALENLGSFLLLAMFEMSSVRGAHLQVGMDLERLDRFAIVVCFDDDRRACLVSFEVPHQRCVGGVIKRQTEGESGNGFK